MAHFYTFELSSTLRIFLAYSGTFTVEGKYRYQPYGLEATPNAVPGVDPRFTYAGQSYASDTGLYHMAAREYDPVGGRFLSRDPPGPGGYGYADDNPVAFVDPSGLDAVEAWRSEQEIGYWDFAGTTSIEGLPDLNGELPTSYAFDAEGTFYGQTIGLGADVPTSSEFGPGELTPVEGVPLGVPTNEVPDDNVLVVRGGRINTGRLIQSEAEGISVSSAPGRTVEELASEIPTASGEPYSVYSVTTRGALREAGAYLFPDSLESFPSHALIYPGEGGAPSITGVWWEWSP